MKFSTYEVLYVRHAAVFGLGTLATRLDGDFAGQFEVTFAKLKEAKNLKFTDKEGSKMLWRSTQDNVTASIGKIIKAVSNLLINDKKEAQLTDLFQYWVQFLPLKYDAEEALGQHEMLLQILSTQPHLILGEGNPVILKTVLMSFIWMYNQEDYVTEETTELIKQVLTNWCQDAKMTQLIATLQIDDASKKKIESIITSQ